MLEDILIFYAPFVVVIASIAACFWLASKDDAVKRKEEH